MADTQILDEGFNSTSGSAWNSSKFAVGLSPSGSAATVYSGDYGRLTTANAGSYSSSGAVSRRFNVGTRQNLMVLAEFRFPGSREVVPRIFVRTPSSSINGTGGYYLEINRNGTITVGGGNQLYTYSIGSLSADTIYSVKLRVVGTRIQAKIWKGDDGDEGSTPWQIDVNDSKVTAAGYAGVWAGPGKTVQNAYFDFDHIYVWESTNPLPAAPVVNVGPSASAVVQSLYARTGTATGTGTLTWSWAMTSKPAGSTAVLTGGSPTVKLTPDVAGDYKITATVTDPNGQSGTAYFILTAVPKSDKGGRLLMGADGTLRAARHRVYVGGKWSA